MPKRRHWNRKERMNQSKNLTLKNEHWLMILFVNYLEHILASYICFPRVLDRPPLLSYHTRYTLSPRQAKPKTTSIFQQMSHTPGPSKTVVIHIHLSFNHSFMQSPLTSYLNAIWPFYTVAQRPGFPTDIDTSLHNSVTLGSFMPTMPLPLRQQALLLLQEGKLSFGLWPQ